MKTILYRFKWTIAVCTVLFSFFSGSLNANSLRLGLGIWPGERDPAISHHLFMDDLLDGFGFGRLDILPWEDTTNYLILPLSAQYFHEMGSGKIFAGLSYVTYSPDHSFIGIQPGAVSFVDIKNYKVRDGELEAGYELTLQDKFTIGPKFGLRHHEQSYVYEEMTLGNPTQITLNNSGDDSGLLGGKPYVSVAQGTFIGANFGFKISPQFSIIGELALTSPILGNLRNSFEGSTVIIGVNPGGNPNVGQYDYSFATADYEIEFLRWMVGVQYNLSDDFHIIGGIRHETLKESYPNYFNWTFTVNAAFNNVNGGFNASEFITDRIFYDNQEETEKGLFFFGITYDIGASGG